MASSLEREHKSNPIPNMARTEDDFLDKLLKLRIAVAYLGEKEQFAWWSTRFLGPAGKRFLEFNYPRSAFAAGVTAASETAKSFHDQRIGKGRVSHLFRLPHTMEQRLRSKLLASDTSPFASIVASKDAAIHALAELIQDSISASEGPFRIGDSSEFSSESTISKLAALYSDAFQNQKQTLPYFTSEKE